MNGLGNILWLVLGGIVIALVYYVVGLLLCISIIVSLALAVIKRLVKSS